MRSHFFLLFFIPLCCHAAETHSKADYLALIAADQFNLENIEYAWSYAEELQNLSKGKDESMRQLYAELCDHELADSLLKYIDSSRDWMMHTAESQDFQRFLAKRHAFYYSVHSLVPGSSREEFIATSISGPERKVTPADAETLGILTSFFTNLHKGLTSKSKEEYRASIHAIYDLLHIKNEHIDKILDAAGEDHSLAKEYVHFTEEFLAGHARSYNSRPDMAFIRLETAEGENGGTREMHVGDLHGTPHLVFLSNSLSNVVVQPKNAP